MKTRFFIAISLALFLMMSLCAYSEEPDFSGYIVRFKNEEAEKKAMELLDCYGSLFGDDISVEEVVESHNMYLSNDSDIINIFDNHGLVEYFEPNYYLELYDYNYPANTYFTDQWAHSYTNIDEAWYYGVYGNGAKVAVIDSGVNTNHTDLAENLLTGESYIDSYGSSNTTDNYGHGTMVSGIIAAAANNSGIVGVAHRAKIVPLKVTDGRALALADVAKLIEIAVNEYRVDVINLSLGSSVNSSTLSNMVNYALNNDIIVVAAAGNNGTSEYSYPASYEGVISVGNGTKDSYGNYIRNSTSQYNDRITISAPGTDIKSTYYTGNNSYSTNSGTSFSAPYVSGVAALAKSISPGITPADFERLLIASADKSVLAEGEERNNYFGYGIVDAGKLIKMLIKEISPRGFISPVDRKTNGEITVKFVNPTDDSQNMSLIAKTAIGQKPIGMSFASSVLAAGKAYEATLSSLESASTSNIVCYLIDTISLSPFCKPITGKLS